MYSEQVVGEPGLKQMCQQEESYSSPIGILLLLQLSSYKPQLVLREDRMWRNGECESKMP